jgi:cell division protein FtsW
MARSQAIPLEITPGRKRDTSPYDLALIGVSLFLTLAGLVMVASSSITIADNLYSDPLFYFWRQFTSVMIGLCIAVMLVNIPLYVWQILGPYFLVVGFICLIAVLIPGIGREVNGSMRWIMAGPINIQSSEIAKFCVILYLAGYMVRREENLRYSFSGFIHPVVVVTLVAGLLLLEPDYGSAVVLFATALGMLFMGGVPLNRFFIWVITATVTLLSLAVLSPYRLQRLTSFIDPWQDPFNTGFQLSQALIAFGRGDWMGVGLGSSVQKLFYLPEAHTDFVFAVLAEEFGLLGSIMIIFMYFILIWRAFLIGDVAHKAGRLFSAYLAYGIGLVIGIQAFINIGVNMGVLPTKGLTLPLISYGNNSIVITFALIALLVRVEMENREPWKQSGSGRKKANAK